MSLKNNINSSAQFAKNDSIRVPKTTFNQHQDIKLSFDMGKLIPLPPIEVIANDTFSVKMAVVTKLLSPQIKPPLDNIKQYFWAFFVPNRLTDSKWKNIFFNYQENPDWTIDNNDQVSQLIIPTKLFPKYSVADYMGLPTNPKYEIVSDDNHLPSQETINKLPIVAYTLIWNNFFRDENLQNSINVDITNQYGELAKLGAVNTSDDIYDEKTNCAVGGSLLPLNKAHDYFTSALPGPQKGAPVTINLGDTAEIINEDDMSKINTSNDKHLLKLATTNSNTWSISSIFAPSNALTMEPFGQQESDIRPIGGYRDLNMGLNTIHFANTGINGQSANQQNLYELGAMGIGGINQDTDVNENYKLNIAATGTNDKFYHNLKADLSTATAVSINDLRYAFQIQKIKEADARHGTRYNEGLLAHFGAILGDTALQIPEFLGMFSMTIKSIQVAQTSASDSTSPQANLSAYSETADIKHLFTKSFVEPGYIIILTGIRQPYHIYSQGIDRLWSRKKRFDFYWPELKNIGEQPILNKEIYFDPNNDTQNNEVFGYQEYAATYRYMLNKVVADMRPTAENNLSLYTYADKYTGLPTLSPEWIKVNKNAVNNTLAIPSTNELKMFMSDIYLVSKTTRLMPLHSIPGLIDHSGNIIY